MQSQKISRRKALTGGAAIAGASLVAVAAAAATTPQERINHHVEGIKQAMREIHPNLSRFAGFVDIDNSIGSVSRFAGFVDIDNSIGSVVMIKAHLKVAS